MITLRNVVLSILPGVGFSQQKEADALETSWSRTGGWTDVDSDAGKRWRMSASLAVTLAEKKQGERRGEEREERRKKEGGEEAARLGTEKEGLQGRSQVAGTPHAYEGGQTRLQIWEWDGGFQRAGWSTGRWSSGAADTGRWRIDSARRSQSIRVKWRGCRGPEHPWNKETDRQTNPCTGTENYTTRGRVYKWGRDESDGSFNN